MDDMRDYLAKNVIDVTLVATGLVAFFIGVFGAVNWHDHMKPRDPEMHPTTRREAIEFRTEEYNRQLAEVGQKAVVPWVWAVPITLTGFAATGVCGLAFMNRHIT